MQKMLVKKDLKCEDEIRKKSSIDQFKIGNTKAKYRQEKEHTTT